MATESLAAAFTQLDRLLHLTLDPLMDLQQAVDPDSFTRYATTRRVITRSSPPVSRRGAPTPLAPAAAPLPRAAQPLAA